jgi:hypothetical protein
MHAFLKYRVILVTLVSFWILFFPAYVHYYNLTEADSLHNLHLENPILEGLLAGLGKKFDGLGWNHDSIMFFKVKSFFQVLPHFSFWNHFLTEKVTILRC